MWDFDINLYDTLLQYPAEVLPIFDSTLHDLAQRLSPEFGDRDPIEIRPYGLRNVVPMRDLNPSDIGTVKRLVFAHVLDKLITVQGMIIRSGTIIPDLRVAFFRCLACKFEVTTNLDRNVIEVHVLTGSLIDLQEPVSCEKCRIRNSFELIHNRCYFANKQCIKLQETVESIPEGETPQVNTFKLLALTFIDSQFGCLWFACRQYSSW